MEVSENLDKKRKLEIENMVLNWKAGLCCDFFKEIVCAGRVLRESINLAPNKKISIVLVIEECSKFDVLIFDFKENFENLICHFLKIESINWMYKNSMEYEEFNLIRDDTKTYISEIRPSFSIFTILDEPVQVLKKGTEKLKLEYEKLLKSLENKEFINKAPVHVVEKTRERLKELEKIFLING